MQRHGHTYKVGGDKDPTLQCLELGHGGEAILLLSAATDVCSRPAVRIQCVRQALSPATVMNIQLNVSNIL